MSKTYNLPAHDLLGVSTGLEPDDLDLLIADFNQRFRMWSFIVYRFSNPTRWKEYRMCVVPAIGNDCDTLPDQDKVEMIRFIQGYETALKRYKS